MPLIARTMALRNEPGAIERYEEFHRQVWPEVLAAMTACGFREVRIWRHERRLFLLVEVADDWDARRGGEIYATSPRTVEWETLMRTMQEPVAGSTKDDWWASMEEVFGWKAPR